MATRPVFVPDADPDQPRLVHEHQVDLQWVPGSSSDRQRENIVKLHAAAGHRNLAPLLEVSPKTNDPLGVLPGRANLAVEDDRSYLVPLSAAYQGSKVFTGGGPFTDLFTKGDEEIDADERLAALAEKKLLEEVVGSRDRFIEVLLGDSFYGPTSVTHG